MIEAFLGSYGASVSTISEACQTGPDWAQELATREEQVIKLLDEAKKREDKMGLLVCMGQSMLTVMEANNIRLQPAWTATFKYQTAIEATAGPALSVQPPSTIATETLRDSMGMLEQLPAGSPAPDPRQYTHPTARYPTDRAGFIRAARREPTDADVYVERPPSSSGILNSPRE